MSEEPPLTEWIDRVRAEYLEMPGLALTRSQMLRLWHLDGAVCDEVVETLVASHFLRHRADHTYVRCDESLP